MGLSLNFLNTTHTIYATVRGLSFCIPALVQKYGCVQWWANLLWTLAGSELTHWFIGQRPAECREPDRFDLGWKTKPNLLGAVGQLPHWFITGLPWMESGQLGSLIKCFDSQNCHWVVEIRVISKDYGLMFAILLKEKKTFYLSKLFQLQAKIMVNEPVWLFE